MFIPLSTELDGVILWRMCVCTLVRHEMHRQQTVEIPHWLSHFQSTGEMHAFLSQTWRYLVVVVTVSNCQLQWVPDWQVHQPKCHWCSLGFRFVTFNRALVRWAQRTYWHMNVLWRGDVKRYAECLIDRALKNNVSTLNVMRLQIGSQCSSNRSSSIWRSRIPTLLTTRAILFCSRSLSINLSAVPYLGELQKSSRVYSMLHATVLAVSSQRSTNVI